MLALTYIMLFLLYKIQVVYKNELTHNMMGSDYSADFVYPLLVNVYTCIYRNPTCLVECIVELQKSIDLRMPTSITEWMDDPRCEVDIRYDMVVADTIRAASNSRFDPTKLMKVI